MNENATSGRLTQLEAARGIACIIVILHHFALAFLPSLKAPYPQGLQFTPAYFFLNGDAAVAFFFTLSGFVLALKLLQKPSWGLLFSTSIKRLPRLAVPAGASILFGYVVLQFFPPFYLSAALHSKSQWLANFAEAGLPSDGRIGFLDALRQSIFVFLKPNDFYYNSNLWTMRLEFFGSLIVFALAFFGGRTASGPGRWLFGLLCLAGAAISIMTFIRLASFFLGCLLAFIWLRRPLMGPAWVAFFGAVLGIGLMCADWLLPNILGSLLLLYALLRLDIISAPLSGAFGAWLGRLSFPIYLVHTLIICSFASLLIVTLPGWLPYEARLAATFLVTLIFTLLFAAPLVWLDESWTRVLRRIGPRSKKAPLAGPPVSDNPKAASAASVEGEEAESKVFLDKR